MTARKRNKRDLLRQLALSRGACTSLKESHRAQKGPDKEKRKIGSPACQRKEKKTYVVPRGAYRSVVDIQKGQQLTSDPRGERALAKQKR